jgi:hypothetical protein
MGGVDRVDQHLADYPIPWKRGKNTIRRFFSCFGALFVELFRSVCEKRREKSAFEL